MKTAFKKIVNFIKKETVLTVAIALAVLSAFLVPPSPAYADYIDWDTLLLLFSLMAVMAGFQKLGFFRAVGNRLLSKVKNTRQLLIILVFLPFFFGMAITNDVALISFVPFGLVVLKMSSQEQLLIPLVAMQTIGANLGSMLTPMGNPQNLYLYAQSGMGFPDFILLLLPYCAISGICLLAAIFCVKNHSLSGGLSEKTDSFRPDKLTAAGYGTAFALCLLGVAKILPPWLLAAVILLYVLLCDRETLKRVDYSLLGTFTAFFIFIGNMGNIQMFRDLLARLLEGRVVMTAVLSSQIISNVPAALLLSGFTDDYPALIVGVNLGGLGTLIASMASLISYKQLASSYPGKKRQYFLWFTLANIAMLLLLLGFHGSLTFISGTAL